MSREMSAWGIMQWDLDRNINSGDPSIHKCWHCGGKRVFVDYRGGVCKYYKFVVWCYDCGTETADRYDSEAEAIDAWNDPHCKIKYSVWSKRRKNVRIN